MVYKGFKCGTKTFPMPDVNILHRAYFTSLISIVPVPLYAKKCQVCIFNFHNNSMKKYPMQSASFSYVIIPVK